MTTSSVRSLPTARLRLLVATLGVSLVSGCIAPSLAPAPPPPDLQLLGAAELNIPPGCEATPGAVYRTHFDVQADGRVTDVASESGNSCVRQALRNWVITFSYSPLREVTPVAFDWMIVTAARND